MWPTNSNNLTKKKNKKGLKSWSGVPGDEKSWSGSSESFFSSHPKKDLEIGQIQGFPKLEVSQMDGL